MAERPKERVFAVRNPSILGNKRRNSSATAARFRMTVRAVGWVMVELCPRGNDTRTKREQCQGSLLLFSEATQAAMPCWHGCDDAYVRSRSRQADDRRAPQTRSVMPEVDKEGERYEADRPQQTPGFYLKGSHQLDW